MEIARIMLCAALLVIVAALGSQTLQWQHYASGKHILSLCSDSENVYVGTSMGMAIYNIQTGSTEYLNNSNSPLTYNWISSIVTLGDGIVWIGTEDGIWRVQGDNWQLFDSSNTLLPSGRATKLKLLPDGTLWCLSGYHSERDYIYRFDGQNWMVFHNGNSTIPGNVIGDIEVNAAGNVYLLYYNTSSYMSGLAIYANDTWAVHDFASLGINAAHVSRLLHDGTNLWITAQVAELYRYDGQSISTIDLSPLCVNDILVTSLNLDSQNNLMLGALIDGDTFPRILRYVNNQWQIIDPNSPSYFLGSPNAVIEDSSGDLWLGTNYGLARYQNGLWQAVNGTSSPLPTNSVNCMTVDAQDRLWLGMYDPMYFVSGIQMVQDNNWVYYSYADYPIPNSNVRLITSDANGKIWFTSAGQVSLNETITSFNGQNWVSYSFDSANFPPATISAIKADANNNLWAAIRLRTTLEYALMKFDGTSWMQVQTPQYYVSELAFDSTGTLWLATYGGLISYDGTDFQIYSSSNSGLPNNQVQCLIIGSDQAVWMGLSNGLAKLHNNEWQVWDSVSSNLPYRDYRDLALDDSGRIWAATDNSGLICFDGTTWTTYLDNNSPLISNAVWGVAMDSQQNLWVGYHTGCLSKIALNPSSIPEEPLMPARSSLELTNYPNPFNPSTTISYKLAANENVCMKLYNLKGQMVRELFSGTKAAGNQTFSFDGKDNKGQALSSGIYYIRLQAGTMSETRKILLMK